MLCASSDFVLHEIAGLAGCFAATGADVDGDGSVDVVAGSSDAMVYWYSNDGSESFSAANDVSSVEHVPSIFAIDVDLAGRVTRRPSRGAGVSNVPKDASGFARPRAGGRRAGRRRRGRRRLCRGRRQDQMVRIVGRGIVRVPRSLAFLGLGRVGGLRGRHGRRRRRRRRVGRGGPKPRRVVEERRIAKLRADGDRCGDRRRAPHGLLRGRRRRRRAGCPVGVLGGR